MRWITDRLFRLPVNACLLCGLGGLSSQQAGPTAPPPLIRASSDGFFQFWFAPESNAAATLYNADLFARHDATAVRTESDPANDVTYGTGSEAALAGARLACAWRMLSASIMQMVRRHCAQQP
jgi:hypothetical protein